MTIEEIQKYALEEFYYTKNRNGDIEFSEGGCCDGYSSYLDEINGICPECGMITVDGGAAMGCNYSPSLCKTCGYRPCDGSC